MREVTIESGRILGVPCGWPGYTKFLGIPYAAPPVARLRWRPPQPASNWDGVRDCARGSRICPQPPVDGLNGFYRREFYPVAEEQDEDCLYLNVWTPARTPEEHLPVMVWIHGGAFCTGYGHSSHFDGEGFCKRGIILVTINYRVNVFGFLAHPQLDRESEHGTSGNYGLLDQICAVRWVYRNISAFGGDPERITLAGQSAGAMSVNCLIASPLLRTPIKGAILESGGGLCALNGTTCRDGALVKKQTDLKAVFGVDSIAEARAIPAEKLLGMYWNAAKRGFPMGPVVDGYVLPDTIYGLALEGKVLDIAYLIGFTGAEQLCIPQSRKELFHILSDEMGEENARLYLKGVPSEPEDFSRYAQDYTSEELRIDAELWALNQKKLGRKLPYLYYFDRQMPGDDSGAFHASELYYVFQTFHRSWRPMSGTDYELSEACCSYWSNFVKRQDPNEAGLPVWEASRYPGQFIELGKRVGMISLPDSPRMDVRRTALLPDV